MKYKLILIILLLGMSAALISCTDKNVLNSEDTTQKQSETTTVKEKTTVTGQKKETKRKETGTLKKETTKKTTTKNQETTTKKESTKKETTKPDFSKMSDIEKYRWEREQMKNNPERKLVMDNDGNEVVYYTKEVSMDSVLATRFYPLKGTSVDTVFYTPWSSGFNLFTHNTKVGEVFDCTESNFKNNKAGLLIDAGIDFFKGLVDYSHKNGIEIFFGMRMNDTHDNQGGWYGPIMFKENTFKVNNLDLLIGPKGMDPKYGNWTAVDYTHKEIRDKTYSYFEEACQNYDIDGIYMDFYRHPSFFKDAANGKVLSQETLELMTDMIRRIRKMTEREGMKRGRPILVAARVPDSVAFNKAIGLDVEQWLKEDLIDILVPAGYTKLNHWEYSVKLGHKYGVKVIPSLDESRVRDKNAKKIRNSLKGYYARVTNVWNSGADGVYLFNYDFDSPLLKIADRPDKLEKKDKIYFASYRGVGYFSRTWPHKDFINIPTVNPYDKVKLKKGRSKEFIFPIGEDLKKAGDEGSLPSMYLQLSTQMLTNKDDLYVELNGKELKNPVITPSLLAYLLKPDDIKKGLNTLKIYLSVTGKDEFIFIKDVLVNMNY